MLTVPIVLGNLTRNSEVTIDKIKASSKRRGTTTRGISCKVPELCCSVNYKLVLFELNCYAVGMGACVSIIY